jgi:hypothetical protein
MIGKVFKTTDLGVPSRFLGMEIVRDWHKREIYLSQHAYLQKIVERFNKQGVR